MPTYHATGLTASLATCDLQASLTDGIALRQGKEWQADSSRVQGTFSSATRLSERPIGEDGSGKGVMQFLGVNEDMPLYVVEAGECVRNRVPASSFCKKEEEREGTNDDDMTPAASFEFSDTSPLTSLGATPSSSFKQALPSPRKIVPEAGTLEAALQSATRTTSSTARQGTQALVLDIELTRNSFLPPQTRNRVDGASLGKDLKVEVFINGQLSDVSFVNARRSAVQIVKDRVRFHGTRVHRQAERPWIYTRTDDGISFDTRSEMGAEQRWNTVANAFLAEASVRGEDSLGDLAPSAEFLMALAGLQLPDRLRSHRNIGIVDVIITAGKGKKYGPSTAYLLRPTRMDNADRAAQEEKFSYALDREEESPFDHNPFSVSATKFPPVPLKASESHHHRSPTPKDRTPLKEELSFNLDKYTKNQLLGAFETSKNKVSKEGRRTLGQRMGDLKKMSPTKRRDETEKLRDEFGIEEISKAEADLQESPTKKRRVRSVHLEDGLEQRLIDALGEADVQYEPDIPPLGSMDAMYDTTTGETIDPQLLLRDPPAYTSNQWVPPYGVPSALLTQDRLDMALGEGAASDGRLLRHIASKSPQRTPQKTTRASALAGSPAHVPVKSPARQRRDPQQAPVTPQRRRGSATAPYSRKSKIADGGSPTRSGRGRTLGSSRKWDPNDLTAGNATNALGSLELSEAHKGSCVQIADGEGMQRQIGKARGGMFEEEQVLVGMRFVVLP